MDQSDRCPDCGEQSRDDCSGGYLYVDGKRTREDCPKKAAAYRSMRINRVRKASGIPRLYEDKTFDNYDPADNPAALDIAQEWAADPAGWIFFYGPVGVGKTHLSCAALGEIINSGGSGRYRSQPDIIASAMPGANPRGDAIDRLVEVSCLVIDDLGAARDTGFAFEQTYRLINGRGNDMLPTVIASNWSIKDMAGKGVDWKRIADRIVGMCRSEGQDRFIKMKGLSRR